MTRGVQIKKKSKNPWNDIRIALMQLPFCFTSRAETKWSDHINVGHLLLHILSSTVWSTTTFVV